MFIGDSVPFGWGVNFEDTYGEVIERELNTQFKKKKTVHFPLCLQLDQHPDL